ncbi:MAG: hypothetical protein HQL40_05210 [Alphaproteobacteria bacterium]|nr:hypothetical protein [Alphaproteobacteria bacterium]
MTRRVLIAGLMLAAACGPAAAEGRLRILNWADYTAPQVIESFQRETGTEVEVTTFATNEEAFERLRDEPGRYDLVDGGQRADRPSRRQPLSADRPSGSGLPAARPDVLAGA